MAGLPARWMVSGGDGRGTSAPVASIAEKDRAKSAVRMGVNFFYTTGFPFFMEFQPLFRNPHLQTIAGHYWKRPRELGRFPVERRFFRTEPDVQVLVESQRPEGKVAGEVVMVHGL